MEMRELLYISCDFYMSVCHCYLVSDVTHIKTQSSRVPSHPCSVLALSLFIYPSVSNTQVCVMCTETKPRGNNVFEGCVSL